MQGVGMLIAADTKSGRLMVLSPLDGSPAARAGIQPGDEVCFPASSSIPPTIAAHYWFNLSRSFGHQPFAQQAWHFYKILAWL